MSFEQWEMEDMQWKSVHRYNIARERVWGHWHRTHSVVGSHSDESSQTPSPEKCKSIEYSSSWLTSWLHAISRETCANLCLLCENPEDYSGAFAVARRRVLANTNPTSRRPLWLGKGINCCGGVGSTSLSVLCSSGLFHVRQLFPMICSRD